MEVTIRECLLGFIAISGQVCAASTRVYVHESIASQFVEALKTATEGSHSLFGDPNESSTIVGSIVDKQQFDRVAGYIEKGKTEGKLVTGGEPFNIKVIFRVSQINVRVSSSNQPSSSIQNRMLQSSNKKFSDLSLW